MNMICPYCGSLQHYTLKDNRLQCAICRKKYTLRRHRSKLSQNTLEHIALSFFQMVPAIAAAVEMGVNSKTVQKYYDLLRRTISNDNKGLATFYFGASTIDPNFFYNDTTGAKLGPEMKPLFCLAKREKGISLLLAQSASPDETFAAEKTILGWVYAKDNEAFDTLDLDRIHFISTAGKNTVDTYSSFWVFAKKGLVKYHGGFRKNFYLFMREMEFRFNSNGNKDSSLSYLISILQGCLNNTETGDDNAQV
jgi:transposase